jgi:hypothetical protein
MTGYDDMKRMCRSASSKRGQAMIEYVVMAGMMLAMVSIMAVLLYALKEHNVRVLDLVSSEYP